MTITPLRYWILFTILSIFKSANGEDLPLNYSNKISSDSLKEFVYILASDSLEGRETGRPGQKKAAYFLASKYYSWKLNPAGLNNAENEIDKEIFNKNIFFQKHTISLRNNKTRNLSAGGETFLFGKDFYYSGINRDTALALNDFIFIGIKDNKFSSFFEKKIFSKKNLILFDANSDSVNIQLEKFEPNGSSQQSPFLVLIITTEKVINKYFSENQKSNKYSNYIQLLITEKVAKNIFPKDQFDKICNKIKSNGKTRIKKIKSLVILELVKNTDQLSGQNILAFIPGSDLKNETVVISSHYDHLGRTDSLIYYGADDNASGTSGVLELARVFSEAKKDGHGPRRNILFLNVSGEEKRLLGSAWYVSNPVFPLKNTIADLNIDMIGRTDAIHDSLGIKNYIYIIGADKMSTELYNINEAQNLKGPRLLLDYKYNSEDDPNRYYMRSDHYNFVKNNIPVIFYFNGTHADYHKPTDTADKIDFEILANRARLVFLTAWELANRNDRPIIDKINEIKNDIKPIAK